MHTPIKIKLLCVMVLALGIALMLRWGAEPPAAVLALEVAILSAAGVAFGFSAFSPPACLRSPHVRGMVCIYLGTGAMFIPASFIVSSFFFGCGIRLLMAEPVGTPRVTACRKPGEIVPRPTGEVTR